MKQKQHKPEKNEDNKSTLAREEQASNDNLSPLEETLEVKADESVPAEKDCAENNTGETAENTAAVLLRISFSMRRGFAPLPPMR